MLEAPWRYVALQHLVLAHWLNMLGNQAKDQLMLLLLFELENYMQLENKTKYENVFFCCRRSCISCHWDGFIKSCHCPRLYKSCNMCRRGESLSQVRMLVLCWV